MQECQIIMGSKKTDCKHSICAICGGAKIQSSFLGRIGTTLSQVCSPKCQAASKDICNCKCGGQFHKGQNSDLLNLILTPAKAKQPKQPKKGRPAKEKFIFEPQTVTDLVAEFMQGKRIKTSSFDQFSDPNLRRDNKKLTLNWLSQKGQPLDQLANDFISEYNLNNYDEFDVIYLIVNYVNDYPAGIKKYIEDVEAERIREQEYYNYMPEVAGVKNKAMKKSGLPKNKKMGKTKSAAKRLVKEATHKDTKSHNVNIKVVSGFRSKIAGLFDTSAIADIDALKKEYFKLAKKYHPDAGGTKEQFQQLVAEYEKHLKTLLSGSKLNKEQQDNELQLDKALRDAAEALAGLQGIDIELSGKWLWVTGNTYPVRNQLKSAGFLFASNKKAWFFKGAESLGRGSFTLEEIRQKYGSTKIMPKDSRKLNGIGSIAASKRAKLATALKRAAKALNKRII